MLALTTHQEVVLVNVGSCPGGATRMARGGIRLVHGHTKTTLITYFSGMKIDPIYAFLHAFFLKEYSVILTTSFYDINQKILTKKGFFQIFS